jgi:AhpC/TSA family protein
MAQTIIYGDREAEIAGATAEGNRLWIPLAELAGATGWEVKAEGICQDDVCVPVPPGRRGEWLDDAGRRLDFASFAQHLGHALARSESRGGWSFGPAAGRTAAEGSGPVVAPDFRLPDLDGALHSLSDYRGKKVLLYCWASW